jgi:beta-N-acetylglucosaminidase
MITTSEGQYLPKPGEDCLSVRVWAEAVDREYITVNMSGHDEHDHANAFVYLQAEDAQNLAEELQKAVETQAQWLENVAPEFFKVDESSGC